MARESCNFPSFNGILGFTTMTGGIMVMIRSRGLESRGIGLPAASQVALTVKLAGAWQVPLGRFRRFG
jgi:hypothetical protein